MFIYVPVKEMNVIDVQEINHILIHHSPQFFILVPLTLFFFSPFYSK